MLKNTCKLQWIYIFSLLFLASCGKEKINEDSIEIRLIIPANGELIEAYKPFVQWELSEFTHLKVELFSEPGYNEESIIHSNITGSVQYTFPDLIPNKVYYLQLTAGNTVFQKELRTKNYLEQYLGTKGVIVNQRTHTAGFVDTTFIGELVISQPNPTTIKLEEAETELSFEVNFQNIIDTTSIWFVSEDPRVNVRFSLQEEDFVAKWYPTGLDTDPFWEYLKNE